MLICIINKNKLSVFQVFALTVFARESLLSSKIRELVEESLVTELIVGHCLETIRSLCIITRGGGKVTQQLR